jgi:hypothetical protein
MTKRPDGPEPATSVNASACSQGNWFSVSPPQGRAPTVLTVTVANAGASRIVHGAGSWQGDPPAVAQASPDQLAAANLFDTITQTVLRMKGNIFLTQTPADLSKAIEEIDRRGK